MKPTVKPTVKVLGTEELNRKFRELLSETKAVLQEAALKGAEVMQAAANDKAPGPHIQTHVSKRRALWAEVEIGPDRAHWYYQFLEYGAQPHTIAPHKAKMLRWFMDTGPVYARLVRHPGIPAEPFLRPAFDESQDAAKDAAGEVIKRAVYGVAK